MALSDDLYEHLKERWESGGEGRRHDRGMEEVLLLTLMTNQGLDQSSLLPLLPLLFGDSKFAIVVAMIMQQQAANAAAAAASGVPAAAPTTGLNNVLPLLLLLMRDRDRDPGYRRPHLVEMEEETIVKPKSAGSK
jgi:hypothetical protein